MWSGWVDYGRRGHAQPWLPRRDEARRGSFRGVHRNDQGSRWNGGRWQQGVDGGFWQASAHTQPRSQPDPPRAAELAAAKAARLSRHREEVLGRAQGRHEDAIAAVAKAVIDVERCADSHKAALLAQSLAEAALVSQQSELPNRGVAGDSLRGLQCLLRASQIGVLELPDVLAAVSGLCDALRRAARLLSDAREAEEPMVAEQPDADVSSMDCDSHGQGPDGPPLEAFRVSDLNYTRIRVRAEPSTEATVLGFRAYLDIVHGRQMGNWVELDGEPGNLLVRALTMSAGSVGETLLERVVSPAASAGATVVA